MEYAKNTLIDHQNALQ